MDYLLIATFCAILSPEGPVVCDTKAFERYPNRSACEPFRLVGINAMMTVLTDLGVKIEYVDARCVAVGEDT